MDTFFFEFVLWIIEESIRHGVEKLYFFTREGEFFSQIYRVVERYGLYPAGMSRTGKRGCRCSVPGAEILEVSRMSTFMPSLREISIGEMMRIWNVYPEQSMAALFRSLQVTDCRLWAYLEKYKINAGEIICQPWKDIRVRQLFKDEDFRACMEAERDRQRERLYAYFAAKGWEQECMDTIGIVDIGWKGTIQDNLCCLYPGRKIIGFYIGLQPFVSPQPENSEKHGFLDGFARQKTVLLTVRPLEMLCNSPNGSVEGYAYREKGSGVYAVRKNDPSEDRVYYDYAAFEQKKIAAKIYNRCRRRKKVFRYISTHGHIQEITQADHSGRRHGRKKAQRAVYRFIAYPDRKAVKAYFSLRHNEEFGIGRYVEVNAGKFRPDLLLQAVFNGSGRNKLKAVLKESEWPQGYLVRYWLHLLLFPYNMLLHRYLKKEKRVDKNYDGHI